MIENKCVQVQIFREKLRSVKKGATFVESTYNDEWGSGLNKTGTENTKISSWPGKIYWGKSNRNWRIKSKRGKGVISGARQSKIQNLNKS